MKFILLVTGIVIFCSAGAWFTLTHSLLALCAVLAGLAMIAGEAFKISMNKEMEVEKLEAEEKKLENELTKPS
jgi:ABC-type siderophore export system fused ATPase/permease subunit